MKVIFLLLITLLIPLSVSAAPAAEEAAPLSAQEFPQLEAQVDRTLKRAYELYDQAGVNFDEVRLSTQYDQSDLVLVTTQLMGRSLGAFSAAHDLAKQAYKAAATAELQTKYFTILERNYWRVNTIVNDWLPVILKKNAQHRHFKKTGESLEEVETAESSKVLQMWLARVGAMAAAFGLHFGYDVGALTASVVPVVTVAATHVHFKPLLEHLNFQQKRIGEKVTETIDAEAFGDFYQGYSKELDQHGFETDPQPEKFVAWSNTFNHQLDTDRRCWKYLAEPLIHHPSFPFPGMRGPF